MSVTLAVNFKTCVQCISRKWRKSNIVVNKEDTVEFLRASSYLRHKIFGGFSAAKNLAANGVSRKFSAAKNSAADTDYGGG